MSNHARNEPLNHGNRDSNPFFFCSACSRSTISLTSFLVEEIMGDFAGCPLQGRLVYTYNVVVQSNRTGPDITEKLLTSA